MEIAEKLQLLLQNNFRAESPDKIKRVITFNIATIPTTNVSFNMFSKQIPGTDKKYFRQYLVLSKLCNRAFYMHPYHIQVSAMCEHIYTTISLFPGCAHSSIWLAGAHCMPTLQYTQTYKSIQQIYTTNQKTDFKALTDLHIILQMQHIKQTFWFLADRSFSRFFLAPRTAIQTRSHNI